MYYCISEGFPVLGCSMLTAGHSLKNYLMLLAGFCFHPCLSVFEQDNSKIYRWIFLQNLENVVQGRVDEISEGKG